MEMKDLRAIHTDLPLGRAVSSSLSGMLELQRLLAEHFATPFLSGVVTGRDYGGVDPVMIGADIYGWATRVSKRVLAMTTSEDHAQPGKGTAALAGCRPAPRRLNRPRPCFAPECRQPC
jgi:hypothetical protein